MNNQIKVNYAELASAVNHIFVKNKKAMKVVKKKENKSRYSIGYIN